MPKTETKPGQEYEGELVTYLPGKDDPPTCKWRGQEFKANVPVRIKDPEHIGAARGNPFFQVGEDKDKSDHPARREPPKTAMEYRAHVVDWMERVNSIDDLAAAWSADRLLREKCEVGQDDIGFLGTLIEPKLKQMRLAAALNEMAVAAIWVKHGVLDLPWRS